MCDARPRRWDHYCHWPGTVRPEFLSLLADDDEIALLLVIHWCAVLCRSPKPFVFQWALRTGYYAISRLRSPSKWENLLIWPLQTFGKRCNDVTDVAPTANGLPARSSMLSGQTTIVSKLARDSKVPVSMDVMELSPVSPG
jgi:hypothetical protein